MPVPNGAFNGARFGQWVREHRKSLDLTQRQVAVQVGCSEATLRKFEAGTRRPSRQMVERLAQFFGVSPAEEQQVMEWARFGTPTDALGARSTSAQGRYPSKGSGLLPPGNLPASLTSLLGREQELAEATDYLLRGKVRLLTLTGPPGVGKTRLAIEIAVHLQPHYTDDLGGVYYVPLVSVRDPALVLPTVARTLRLSQAGEERPLDALKEALRDRLVLFVLDNFEQVVSAAPSIVELLEACPRLCVLATSREALRVRGEQQLVVRTLPLPNPERAASTEDLLSYPSVALFEERARAVNPGFRLTDNNAAAVAKLCTRFDGLPLAIELAAAQSKVLSPQMMIDMLGRLGSRLTFLSERATRDLPPHQRTLREAIEWSYALLPPQEQALFAYLSVFANGFTLEGAEAVGSHALSTLGMGERVGEQIQKRKRLPTGGDAGEGDGGNENEERVSVTLRSLVDKSLLQSMGESGGEVRYTMLETIREYAAQRLEKLRGAHDAHDAHRSHAEYYLALVEQAEPELTGQEQAIWLERLEQEHQNLRAALEWTLVGEEEGKGRAGASEAGEVEMGARIAGALVRFWVMHGHWSEGRRWLKSVLARSASVRLPRLPRLPVDVLAKVLFGAGRLASFQDDHEEAHAYFSESLALYRQLGDKSGMTEAFNGLALLAAMRGDRAAAKSLLEESLGLSRSMGELRGAAKTLSNLAQITIEMGDLEEAELMQTEALGMFRELGDKWGMGVALENLGQLAAERGDYEHATRLLQESLLLTEELGDKARLSWVLGDLGIVWLSIGDYSNATDATRQALELFREMGDKNGQGLADYILGVANLYRENIGDAKSCFTRSLLTSRQLGLSGPRAAGVAGCAAALGGLAAVTLRRGEGKGEANYVRAARLLGISAEFRLQQGGYRVKMVERPLYEHTAHEAQIKLGNEAFNKAWEDGRSLPLAQVISYSLGDL